MTTKKHSPSILLCVNLISEKVGDPDSGEDDYKFNQLYLSNYATLNIKDVLARIEGVGDVTFLGPRDYSMRIWLDPEKPATLGMTPGEVVAVLRDQNRQVPAGRIGQPPIPPGQDFQYPLSRPSRLASEAEFGEVISSRRVVPSSSSRTWCAPRTASNSVPETTTSTACLDGDHRLHSRSSSSLAPTRWKRRQAIKKAMKRICRRGFPKGLQYKIVYDTTVFIDESIKEVYKTSVRGVRAGVSGRADLPAGLARHALADDRRACVVDRHFRSHGASWAFR